MTARFVGILLFATTLYGCDRADSNACPFGTSAVRPREHGFRRLCVLPDGRFHGPVLETDKHGVERRVEEYVDGELEGRSVTLDSEGRLMGERHYRRGLLDGRQVMRIDGTPFSDCYWRAGVLHGPCMDVRGDFRHERYFNNGQRAGTWRRLDLKGQVVETRVYRDNGILTSVNGRAVPAPAEWIALVGGTGFSRSGCEVAKNGTDSPCLDLFETHQQCAFDPSWYEHCRAAATDSYLKAIRKRW